MKDNSERNRRIVELCGDNPRYGQRSELAREYGVTTTTVTQVLRREKVLAERRAAVVALKGLDREALLEASAECLSEDERFRNCMHNENITTIRQLISRTEVELRRIPNFGGKTLRVVKEALASLGLSLRTETYFVEAEWRNMVMGAHVEHNV